MEEYGTLLALLHTIATEAGDNMRTLFGGRQAVAWKPGEMKTAMDVTNHAIVMRHIKNARQPFSLFGEEGVREVSGARYTLYTDECDGSAMSARGIPLSAFSAAFVDNATGKAVAGVVEEPFGMLRRRYWATLGGPAYMSVDGGVRTVIHANNAPLDHTAMVNVEWWPGARPEFDFTAGIHALALRTKMYPVTIGSTIVGLMGVARGEFVACVSAVATSDKLVDSAAAGLILRAAGAVITDLHGNGDLHYDGRTAIPGLLATNGRPGVHDALLAACRPLGNN